MQFNLTFPNMAKVAQLMVKIYVLGFLSLWDKNTNWEPILNNNDANESYELFQSTLLYLFLMITFLFRLKTYITKQTVNLGLPWEY